jgi:hypothetical protein
LNACWTRPFKGNNMTLLTIAPGEAEYLVAQGPVKDGVPQMHTSDGEVDGDLFGSSTANTTPTSTANTTSTTDTTPKVSGSDAASVIGLTLVFVSLMGALLNFAQ